jgi:diguanylate cyclase (GGDEF)-like protein
MLLLVGMSAGFAGRAGTLARERNQLTHDALEQAQVLNAYFARSSSIVLLTAHNPAFAEFYAEPGDRDQRIRRGGKTLDRANQALSYLEQLYPDRIGEACFIDASGAEIARTVRGERAQYADLSKDESRNPFFAPSFKLDRDRVYQAKPYVSPDTNEWVVANSTLVPMADGSKPAIVHFEISVDSFRREAAAQADRTVLVIDGTTGDVVIDSRHPQQIGAPLGDASDTRFRALVGGWATAGRMQLGGRQAAYRRITPMTGNANNWYVVSVSDAVTGPLTGVGFSPIVLVIGTLLLIMYLLVALRRGQRTLVSAANTDTLTGLYNRRRLVADLDRELGRATASDPLLLILCDLNGFKAYNDTFGHPAGDALLERLGAALSEAVGGRGRAYRIGGDEFCVLARPGADGADAVVRATTLALSEHGDGFSITASHGAVLLPIDAPSAAEAMRVVDLRMYENKNSGRVPADTQTANALVRAMDERDHDWAERVVLTAELAGQVCRVLEVPPAEEARVRQAARLHDVGKVGIPDDILQKRGALTAAEWAFIRQAPSIGERIVSSAPALAPVVPLIRSAREWYDGTGYPAGLAGDEIPLGARIIAVCAAVTAMTTDQAHRRRQDLSSALVELDRTAGIQFDPQVVVALKVALQSRAEATGAALSM